MQMVQIFFSKFDLGPWLLTNKQEKNIGYQDYFDQVAQFQIGKTEFSWILINHSSKTWKKFKKKYIFTRIQKNSWNHNGM